jgi:hypothetical protein
LAGFYCLTPPGIADPLRSGFGQFQTELRPHNVTRLSRIDWLWSAKRASVWVTGGSRCRVN